MYVSAYHAAAINCTTTQMVHPTTPKTPPLPTPAPAPLSLSPALSPKDANKKHPACASIDG
jgi:hypothetical protein